jgi:Domain of unknown function (DUF222)/HNH endonuclease
MFLPETPKSRSAEALLDAAVEADRIIAMATAMKLEFLEAASHAYLGDRAGSEPFASFRAEAALALRIPERTAGILLDEGFALTTQFPATLAALREGIMTPRHARIVIDATATLDDDARADVERRALREVHRSTSDFARLVRRWCERRAPETATERHRGAFGERHVALQLAADGMAYLTAYVTATEAVAMDTRLDDAARALHLAGDTRTFSQLRADVFTDVMLDRISRDDRAYRGTKPTVVVTIPVLTLLGRSVEPGELLGYGPIDPETARTLASETPELRRMFLDPLTAIPLALGREKYRPSRALRLWLRLRDRTCRFPGCGNPVTSADIDHTRDWAREGRTDSGNLAHLCRKHHTLKHNSGWRVRQPTAGTLEWTSPLGRGYLSHAPGTEPHRRT